MVYFLWWCVHEGQKGYPTQGNLAYAPLPSNIVSADEKQIKAISYKGSTLYK
jgi:hypothetical protein